MTTEPPDTCPVCGAGIHETDDNNAGQIDRVWLGCGATWAMYRDGSIGWKEQCPHAMTACLRTGATLHPTARETAAAALVAAVVKMRDAVYAMNTAEGASRKESERLHVAVMAAQDVFNNAALAYECQSDPQKYLPRYESRKAYP